jgi:polyamine oxidase
MSGFSDHNNLCIDQRGFKTIIQAEAADFLQPDQVSLNSVVTTIAYDGDGVTVTLENGTDLTADYVLCTFSLGVLQYGDIAFKPALPSWKVEAIQSMDMVCLLNANALDNSPAPRVRIPKSSCNLKKSSGLILRYV